MPPGQQACRGKLQPVDRCQLACKKYPSNCVRLQDNSVCGDNSPYHVQIFNQTAVVVVVANYGYLY